MGVRSKWAGFCCAVLAAAAIGPWLSPNHSTVFVIEAIDQAVYDGVVFRGFTEEEETLLREEMLSLFTTRCTEEFVKAGLQSPSRLVRESGLVVRHFRHLYFYEAEDLGLVYRQTWRKYRSEFSTGRVQAATVPAERHGRRLTADGRPILFIHDTAFSGASWVFGRYDLGHVLAHEMIHACGQPSTPGWLWFLDHDLAGFEPYERIIEACR